MPLSARTWVAEYSRDGAEKAAMALVARLNAAVPEPPKSEGLSPTWNDLPQAVCSGCNYMGRLTAVQTEHMTRRAVIGCKCNRLLPPAGEAPCPT